MGESLKAIAFKDSSRSFLLVLDESGIEYSRRMQLAEPVSGGVNIDIFITGGWAALAVACLAWAHGRKSRRINVTNKSGDSVWLEGYSAKDAEKILKSAQQIAVIDTEPDERA